MGAGEQPHVVEPQADLVHRPLELRHRARLVHAGVDQHDPGAGRDRPRVAVRHAGPAAAAAAAATVRVGPARRVRALAARVTAAHDIGGRRRGTRLGASMSSTADIATRYFEALAAHDLDAAIALLAARRRRAARRPAGADRPGRDPRLLRASCSARSRTSRSRSLEVTAHREPRRRPLARARHVRRPGHVPGLRRQRRAARDRGLRRADRSPTSMIEHNDAYLDSGDVARQLGVLPPAGSRAEARLTRARQRAHPRHARGSTAPSPSGSPRASGSSAAASRSRR